MDATHTSRVVLSSEVFEEEPEQLDQKWKAIANAFSDFDIKIIFYIRRQDEFIVSAYSTILVNHPTFKGTVADLARKYLNGEKLVPINASIDYFDKLQTLSKFVGKPNIVVKVMEKEQMPGGLFADFLGIFQLPLTNDLVIPDRGKSNQSYTEEMLDVLRILKNVYGHEKFEQFVARLPRNSLGKPNMLNYRKRKEILEQYKESNAKLAKEYLNRSNGELFLGKLNKEETNRTFFEGITKRKLARILGDLALQQK
ncbi:MAG: hypothetical protein JXX29_22415 [Deltaproteobacteria bacterium]|nr:hypothetical protein [Deltaproteobacteria bacterium]MBN2674451.1 hypothetical protein [Deltaproteobacteria bacterium]